MSWGLNEASVSSFLKTKMKLISTYTIIVHMKKSYRFKVLSPRKSIEKLHKICQLLILGCLSALLRRIRRLGKRVPRTKNAGDLEPCLLI